MIQDTTAIFNIYGMEKNTLYKYYKQFNITSTSPTIGFENEVYVLRSASLRYFIGNCVMPLDHIDCINVGYEIGELHLNITY